MGASILTARNLSKVVPSAEGELTILHELSLELNQGDSLAIVGASGSGKSTLLGLLAGLDLPSSGEVILAGQGLSVVQVGSGRCLEGSDRTCSTSRTRTALPAQAITTRPPRTARASRTPETSDEGRCALMDAIVRRSASMGG